MLKTQEEVLEWLLNNEEGNYKELVAVAGEVMTCQLELLGYIKRRANSKEDRYALTRRGRRVALATRSIRCVLNNKESRPKERVVKKETRFEKIILP